LTKMVQRGNVKVALHTTKLPGCSGQAHKAVLKNQLSIVSSLL
jgi:hypothetical protein